MSYLGLESVVVRDYDEAIAFYVDVPGFSLLEDTRIDDRKRWVVVAPPGARESAVLLARAVTGGQEARIGDQTGGRVGWFLNTETFERDYARMRTAGVVFEEIPRTTNPIESTFSTVKLRTKVTRGAGSPAAALAMVFKLAESAQTRWRAITAPHLVAFVRNGARFERGVLVEREQEAAA